MMHRLFRIGFLFATVCLVCRAAPADELAELVKSALVTAGENRAEIQQALDNVPAAQKGGMLFLVAHMPERDLKSLSAAYLLENVAFGYRAWQEAPWKDRLPEDVFLNNVLPYASINERRDDWRKDFYGRFRPLVNDIGSPATAAAVLNQKIFPLLKVRYSTQRPKADQSPFESIEAGLASCTGLSLLLIDACRAVGVPARFAGTPLWSDGSGNHSWVEIWDDGWHFTGAAEPTGDNLDRAWFSGRAATAQRDHPLHAIYAVSYQRTPLKFPTVWNRSIDYVYAVNVTDRYTKQVEKKPRAAGHTEEDLTAATGADLDAAASEAAVASLQTYLKTEAGQRPELDKQAFSTVALTRQDADVSQRLLWQDHVQRIRAQRAAEMQARLLREGDLQMPFFCQVYGDKPEGGRSLYLSLHGGGGAPPAVNDQQWENQKRLYRPAEGVYVAPRAPTNTWNLWHEAHIDKLFGRLIENMIVFEDVDPDRVYLLGYSAGGDGVYQLAPRMADRWAAAAMMAGHPNETSPLGLRNVAFTIHVGGRDAAYKRNEVARQWGQKLDELQRADPDGYVHLVKVYPDKSHWLDREDAAALPWMARSRRNPVPARVVWYQDDVTHTRFYWLAVAAEDARKGTDVVAGYAGQQIDVQAKGVERLTVRLNDMMLDLDEPVTVVSRGKQVFEGRVDRTIAVLARTLDEYGDPKAVFRGEVTVSLTPPP